MNGMIYKRNIGPEDSVINRDDYLVVTKRVNLKDRILLSPIVKYVVPTLIAVTCLLATVYLTMYFVLNNTINVWTSTCNIRASYRIDCFPGRSNVSYDECNESDCCWNDERQICFHSVPSRHGYKTKNDDSYQDNEILTPRRSTSPFGRKNAESLILDVKEHVDPDHVEIVFKIGQSETREKKRINDRQGRLINSFSGNKMFTRVPVRDDLNEKLLDFLPKTLGRKTVNLHPDINSKMDVYVHTPEFSVTVTRKNDTSGILTTARGPLILTKNFWEMTLYLTNSSLYGLNQLELNGTTNWIYDNENGTSTAAFLGINNDGEGTSCFVSYKGPMEIKVINESNLIVLKGFSLPSEISIHLFAGPTPLDAVKQLTKALKNNDQKIDDIELSSLGLHICPNEDSNDFLKSLSDVIKEMIKEEAPWDTHCIHQDFNPTLGNSMDDKISIVKEAMKLLTEESKDRTIVPHLSPMVFADGNTLSTKLNSNSLLLRNSSRSYIGSYRKHNVFYPNWNNTNTHDESIIYLNDFLTNFENLKLIYVRDSWPKDDTEGHPVPNGLTFDYIPRVLQSLMVNGTVPYTLMTSPSSKSHYTEHNSYSRDFRNFLEQQGDTTCLVIRGLWGESGNSSWSALRTAIRAGVGSGIVGQLPSPMYACGTGSDKSYDELCSRWYGASVAWPHVLALHSNLPGGVHLTPSSTSYAIKHLRLRSSLVTYVYTIMAQYHIEGSPILSPLSIYYPNDLQARHRWNQFMWGHGILVGLVTLPKVKQVPMWIPGKYSWRHLKGGAEVFPTKNETIPITTVEGHIVTLIRPASIIPIHEEILMTSASTIKSELTLVANLACDESECNAHGTIFYGSRLSDGAFLTINVTKNALNLSNIRKVKAKACITDETKILRQGTYIRKIDLLGYSVYEVNTNFCNIEKDSIEIAFNKKTR